MPLVFRAETDIFRLTTVSDYMVYPTNIVGAMNKGLGLEFQNRVSGLYDYYKNLCMQKTIHVGQTYPYKPKNGAYTTLLLPTKRHWVDATDIDNTKRALRALRRFLLDVPKRTVAMPSLSASIKDPAIAKDVSRLMYTYLNDLPNIIYVSMWPDDFSVKPRYLGIIGSHTLTDRAYVESCIKDACTTWSLDPKKDFLKWVSSQQHGVDEIACGFTYEDTKALVHTFQHKDPVIVFPDVERYGTTAYFKQNRLVVEMATHIIGIVDPKKSNATRMALNLAYRWNKRVSDAHKKQTVLYKYA